MKKGSKLDKVSPPETLNLRHNVSPPVEEIIEEDETVDSEDEEDKFDIDDSSPEAAASSASEASSSSDLHISSGHTGKKVQEATANANQLSSLTAHDHPFIRSRKSPLRSRIARQSEVDSPSRSGLKTHPPRLGQFVSPGSDDSDSATPEVEQEGARDNIHSPRATLSSTRSRIPKDRDVEAESMGLKTPTMPDIMRRIAHHKAVSGEHHGRAFAVWGHDESDSNASDSDL
jgi:NAD+ kinase